MFESLSPGSSRAAKRRRTIADLGISIMSGGVSPDGAPEQGANASSATAISVADSSTSNDSSAEHLECHTQMSNPLTVDHEPPLTSTAVLLTSSEESRSRGWPAERIPVEIFNLIIQHLPRKAVQTMRLVNHEFDAKLAEIYFKSVVVPFRPEFEALYGSLNIDPGSSSCEHKIGLVIGKSNNKNSPANDTLHASANDGVLSAGYRVFEQFGDKMRKFALALELNEKDLASPPLKINQEILAAPWGLYRWPIMRYQRYSRVEGLEQMANETGYMLQAFRLLKYVTEIGISCDAGLGWLCGPDTNPFCARTLPPVFRPIVYEEDGAGDNASVVDEEDESLSLSILKQMALNAGYSETEWPRIILRLLEDEGREGVIGWMERILPCGRLTRDRIPYLVVDDNTTKEDIILQIKNAIACDGESTVVGTTETRRPGLIPSLLTMAQIEMLLELEWAHLALMQSYRIAVMDNKTSFQNLKQLTIARCPSCRISTWCDDEFWETMTSIETFHLGVIPDWRKINKDSTGNLELQNITPSGATRAVFELLQLYVGEQKNVKNVSFEWVCGGEFAMGKSQRDRYILPAPILADISNMVKVPYDFQPDDMLNLPYVSKLSLKNCWFTPHVFVFFFQHMFLEDLGEVVLESVSLTGPPSLLPRLSIYPVPQYRPSHWPWPLCVGAEPGYWFQLQRPQNHNPPPAWHGVPAVNFQLVPNPFQAGPLPQPNQPAQAAQAAPGPGPMPAINGALQNPTGAIPVNDQMGPMDEPVEVELYQWRAWSWPHVLAFLKMLPDTVVQYLKENSNKADMAHEMSLKSEQRLFAARFKAVLEDRVNNGDHRVFKFKFKSCGYALVESLNVDNWKIIPDHAIKVRQSAEFSNRLKDLDNSMLTAQDAMMAKILNYMSETEELQLQFLFGFELGWDHLYDPIVKQAAIADGNPHPGQARFSGELTNKPTGNFETEKAEFEENLMGLYRS